MTTTSNNSTPMPIYKSKGAARVGNHWEVFSVKLNRIVRLYSDLEYDHWLLVESDPRVLEYCEQPCYASIWHESKWSASIPDMWIRYINGKETYIEIKYSRDLEKQNERSIKQIEIQKKWAESRGVDHQVLTEKIIRKNRLLLLNLSKMAHATRLLMRTVSAKDRLMMKNHLINYMNENKNETTISDVLKTNILPYANEIAQSVILAAIFSGEIYAPIDTIKMHDKMSIILNTKIS